jgi:hypothetical protein
MQAIEVAPQGTFPEKVGKLMNLSGVLPVNPEELQGDSLFKRDLQGRHCLGFILRFSTFSVFPLYQPSPPVNLGSVKVTIVSSGSKVPFVAPSISVSERLIFETWIFVILVR